MKFSVNREALLRPLQQVAGAVERRQTLPILSNVLLDVHEGSLSLVGTDLEVELLGKVSVAEVTGGRITVPGRKLMDIIRQLPEKAEVHVKKAISIFGKIDVLINNGGISQRSKILGSTFKVFQTLIEVDYLGTVALSHALLPHFVNQKKGHFVVLSSVMGKFASPFRSGYCAAKHALHGFFLSLIHI